MNNKAIWKYFLDINMFNIPFSLIFMILGVLWSVVMFSSFGVLIGCLGFKIFKENEYYAYYNLGLTKAKLMKKVWFINLTISVLIFVIYLIIK